MIEPELTLTRGIGQAETFVKARLYTRGFCICLVQGESRTAHLKRRQQIWNCHLKESDPTCSIGLIRLGKSRQTKYGFIE